MNKQPIVFYFAYNIYNEFYYFYNQNFILENRKAKSRKYSLNLS